MKTPADGWSQDERDAFADLEGELEALQARHASDPPLDLLRAASEGVLPEPLQARLTERLNRSRWDRALVDGVAQVDPTLDAEGITRLYQRIQSARPQSSRWQQARHASPLPSAAWRVALAAAAVLLFALAGWMWRVEPQDEPAGAPDRGRVQTDRRLLAPAFVLALDVPEIKLSASALVFRGRAGASLLNDLKPAVDAFRAADYAAARREFARLAPLYPMSVEVAFYDGVARLYLGDLDGAEEQLARAERIGDEAFAQEITWYRAIVDERAGRRAQARMRIMALCRSDGPRAAAACTAAEGLKEP